MLLSSYIIVFKITYYSFQFLHQSIFYYKNTLWHKVLFRDCRQQPSMYIGRCFHHITLVIHHSPLVPTPPLLGRSLRIGEYVNGVRIPLSFASKPRFYHFLYRCIILLINNLYTLSIPIVQDSYKLPISSL